MKIPFITGVADLEIKQMHPLMREAASQASKIKISLIREVADLKIKQMYLFARGAAGQGSK